MELEFILDLKFVKFWAFMVKNTYVIEFMDSILMNMRKNNDIYKLIVESEDQVSPSLKRSTSYGNRIKLHMTELLQLVLRLFFRMSSNIESETEFFPLEFY
jgi:hypothetical protein